jgi:Activator of Hsp90 ATPase homolog 1-like protein
MARDGADHWAQGTYHQIVPDERLIFSYRFAEFGVQSVVSVRFEVDGQGTRMRFLQTGFPDAENHAGHATGWTSTFAILEDLVLKLHGIGSVYPTLPPARVSGLATDLAEARRRHDAEVSAARGS